MRSFDSFGDFAEHLARIASAAPVALHRGVQDATEVVLEDARDEIGKYQDAIASDRGGVGLIPAWEQLAPSTEKQKERAGYPLDAPLLASGGFRDKITKGVVGLQGVVGTEDERGVWFEMGTPHMPPRAVFAPAAIRNEAKVLRILAEAAMAGLIGGDLMFVPLSSE